MACPSVFVTHSTAFTRQSHSHPTQLHHNMTPRCRIFSSNSEQTPSKSRLPVRSFIPHPTYTQAQLSAAAARAMEPDPDRGVSLLSPAPNPSHQPCLRAAKSTAFKREERRKHKEQKRERKRQENLALALAQWEPLGAPPRPAATSPPGAPPDDKPWPCDPPSPADAAPSAAWGWGPPAEPSADSSWGPPAEPPIQPPVAARCPQADAVRACRALFEEHADNDDDGDEEGEEEEGDVARFFDELLEKDAGLRGFYEAERETGLFLCLVCEGVGARAGKRFPGCAALVQHAGSVARTKRRFAHRAFADALDRLLGWGAGRTTPFPADCDNDGASDQAEHLDDSEGAEMEVA